MAINRRLSIPSYARFGQLKADPSATWEVGSILTIGAAGLKNVATVATDWPFGIAWTNRSSVMTASHVETGVLDYSDASYKTANLNHAGVIASNYVVLDSLGATLSDGGDYSFAASGGSRTNGVIAAVGGGKLDADGTGYTDGTFTIYYRYTLSTAEKNGFLDDLGNQVGTTSNWNNSWDESCPEGQVTVAADGSLIYTDQYVATDVFTAGLPVYSNNTGLTTVATAAGGQVGRVIETPTATQPFLGILVTAR